MLPTPGKDLALRAVADGQKLGETERYWRMNAAEALYEGCAYEGAPSFWEASVPLRERAPAVQSMLVRTAGDRLIALVFGDRTFPTLKVEPVGWRVALSETDQAALSALVQELSGTAKLRPVMRAMLRSGLRAGTACAVTGFRDGLPSVDLLPAKWCTPTFARDGSVASMRVEYRTQGDDGKWYLHRRDVGPEKDTTFRPVCLDDLKRDEQPRFVVESETPLPFVPVVWCRNLPDRTVREVDGYPLGHNLDGEVRALDMELSQLHRTALYNGEPQLVRIGVDGQNSMGPSGRVAAPEPPSATGAFSWFANAWKRAGSGGDATKKGPGTIWNLPQGSDAKMLESTGAGAEIIAKAIEGHRRVILDAMGVVLASPSDLGSGDLSARALSILMAPMLSRADELRVDYGDALVAIVGQLLRWCSLSDVGEAMLATVDAARPVLARLYAPAQGGVRWIGPRLALGWGEFFEPSWTEIQSAVAAMQTARGGGPVVSARRAVEMLAPVLGVEDVDAEVAAVEADEAKGAARATSLFGVNQQTGQNVAENDDDAS